MVDESWWFLSPYDKRCWLHVMMRLPKVMLEFAGQRNSQGSVTGGRAWAKTFKRMCKAVPYAK